MQGKVRVAKALFARRALGHRIHFLVRFLFAERAMHVLNERNLHQDVHWQLLYVFRRLHSGYFCPAHAAP